MWSSITICSVLCVFGASEDPELFDDVEARAASAWIVAPPQSGEITEKDRAATESLINLIRTEGGEAFRQTFRVVIPNKPTGLPEDYDVLIYGEVAGGWLLRLEVNVRGDRATAEMVTADGVYRGELAAEPIDQLARQLAYAFRAEVRRIGWGAAEPYASHARHERIEVLSRDERLPFHLRTEPWQPIIGRLLIQHMPIRRRLHTKLAIAGEKAAREKLKLLKPTEQLQEEILARLRAISAPPARPSTGSDTDEAVAQWGILAHQLSLEDYRRDELASIEAKLYSRLAVEWRLAEAMSELCRLGLKGAARRLAIAVSSDPGPLLQTALLSQSGDLFFWALNFTRQMPSPAREKILTNAADRSKDGYAIEDILQVLCLYEVAPAELGRIERFYQETEDVRSKVAAARFLLWKTDSDRYYDFLTQLALAPQKYDTIDLRDPEARAISGLLEYSAENRKRRRQTAATIRTILRRINRAKDPSYSGLLELVSYLGKLGGKQDLGTLSDYSERHQLVRTAILAIARIDPRLALEKVRREFRKYVGNEGVRWRFDLYVSPYLDLIFWQRDLSSIPLLEEALLKHRREPQDEGPTYWSVFGEGISFAKQTELLLGYLKASTLEERLHYALRYAQVPYTTEEWLKEVGKQLVGEGADPEKCRPLLAPDPDRGLGRWPHSKEGELW